MSESMVSWGGLISGATNRVITMAAAIAGVSPTLDPQQMFAQMNTENILNVAKRAAKGAAGYGTVVSNDGSGTGLPLGLEGDIKLKGSDKTPTV